jgi:hypothetical protein
MQKIYHIYAKNKCIMHSVSEEDFNVAWETLNRMINIIKTDYSQNDLSYEELILKKELEASY